jgi:Mg2+ and Co2+ transporter CorA
MLAEVGQVGILKPLLVSKKHMNDPRIATIQAFDAMANRLADLEAENKHLRRLLLDARDALDALAESYPLLMDEIIAALAP